MSRLILALDQGTTSSRAILFDHEANPVATAQRTLTQYFPHSGWVEHDAQEIWKCQAPLIAEVLAKAHASPTDIAALGIANQRETTVLWDRTTGEPVARAIVWQDRRTAEHCARLRAAGHEPEIARRTGLVLDPYFSATKLAWLLEHVPGARARAKHGELAFGTIDSWLIWNLTGGKRHVTDATNASRTLLFNLSSCAWDPLLLELFGIPPECLPQVIPTSARATADLTANLAGCAVPLTGVAGDQQAALFGQTCFTPGMAKNTYGTGCFALLNTGTRPLFSQQRLLTTVAWQREGTQYALEGSVFVAGAVVQWLRDALRVIDSSAEVESLATSVADCDGVHFVPAFAGLGSPHWDPHARGTIVGLSRGSTRAHVARAALEAIAFQSAELLAAMQRDAGQPLTELRVDGGAAVNNFLMQFQADILGVAVVRPRSTETTALGAAYLAGLAVGFWESLEEIARNWHIERRFEPSMSRDEAIARLKRWSRAVERSRGWA
ncbi:MAG TPA: glycerol kinase GlpK [Steroidobacteraceae bacterium]|jgi:glycerol kinase|nr:glycerol kinase GlpK [Steroidobacteraceae bacterium]